MFLWPRAAKPGGAKTVHALEDAGAKVPDRWPGRPGTATERIQADPSGEQVIAQEIWGIVRD
jgi:hypothetical protein